MISDYGMNTEYSTPNSICRIVIGLKTGQTRCKNRYSILKKLDKGIYDIVDMRNNIPPQLVEGHCRCDYAT
jgi:hypothetical protein